MSGVAPVDGELCLVWPARAYLPGYMAALAQGWSPNNVPGSSTGDTLGQIEHDPDAYLARMVDRAALGPAITLPDGSVVARLPGYRMWLWDGEFCGVMDFRWQPGTASLPAHVLGHVGYAVIPAKRGKGYATRGLRLFLRELACEGLPYVELTTDPDNIASQKVITRNGGVLLERFRKPAQYGEAEGLRYRIALPSGLGVAGQ
ncbi:GNAT family N-acetyltransferase [Chitinimonas viridis]|uniref:GNAT family N-acetyltransferase n=1 Tax=Chitinimonas viridis TaxID=664880 RepID=A0ABT8B315_9NEIS|nr:GNAT family N-acetyltransferase [Chitinimonas viridis]MDN3576652.1 GNAT family N-acetyltransferase [Chitinimonas viridis]